MDSNNRQSIKLFETKQTPQNHDLLAPDGSEIRLLPTLTGGSMCHCSLQPGQVSQAVRHKTVEEIWYFLAGEGEVWRRQEGREEVTKVKPGISLTIPLGTSFQFRNTRDTPLEFIIVTMPPWPGENEAVKVENYWKIP